MKALLRQDIRNKLSGLSKAAQDAQGRAVASKVLCMPDYSRAKHVGVYLQAQNEVATDEILKHIFASGKTCYAPRVLDTKNMELLEVFSIQDLESFPRNKWGIVEPPLAPDRKGALANPSVWLDVILVPGMAFDSSKARLGKGKGYYDRFLNNYMRKVTTAGGVKPVLIGLGFKEQMVDKVPTEPHDILLDYVVTSL